MASSAKTALKASFDGASDATKAAMKAAASRARALVKIGGRTPPTSTLNDMATTGTRSADELAQSMTTGVNSAEAALTEGKNIAPTNPTKGMNAVDKVAWYKTKAAAYGITGTTLVAGITGISLMAASQLFLDNTDDVTVTITRIERSNTDPKYIRISYNPPSSLFHPGINDTFEILTATPTTPNLQTQQLKIVGIPDDSSVVVEATITSIQDNPSSWGTAKCHSSFGNQLGTTIGDGIRWFGDNIVDPVFNAGKDTFCALVPFLCDSTTLWWIGGICGVIMCIICAVMIFAATKK